METIMDTMVNRTRKVGGKGMSLLDLGYDRVGVDGGWNYCFPSNKTFHWKDGTPIWPVDHKVINKNGATSGFEMCFAASNFGAGGPNQNTSRIQHKEL